MADYDEDGLSDLQEFNIKSNPDESDTDNDGLSDGEELFNYLTDPTSNDTDGDGQPDGWEMQIFSVQQNTTIE